MSTQIHSSPYRDQPRRSRRVDDTGAYQTPYMAASAWAFTYEAQRRDREKRLVNTANQVVLALTRQLGLSMSAAANVLHVTRPTLYSWLKMEREPQTAQLNRINEVNKAVKLLIRNDANGFDLDFSAPLPDGSSILSILSGQTIDDITLGQALSYLRRHPTVLVTELSDEELNAPPVVTEALVSLFQTGSTWTDE